MEYFTSDEFEARAKKILNEEQILEILKLRENMQAYVLKIDEEMIKKISASYDAFLDKVNEIIGDEKYQELFEVEPGTKVSF